MITNEEMTVSFPDDVLRAIVPACTVDTFEGNFDSQNFWMLLSPFDTTGSGIAPGMVARISSTGFTQRPERICVIDAVTATGFELRFPGRAPGTGRGPGAEYGSDIVKIQILDMQPALEQAWKLVDHRFGRFQVNDPAVQEIKSAAVKRLAIVRAAGDVEFLKTFTGSSLPGIDDYETRVLDKLGFDLLMNLSRSREAAAAWPRIGR
jgi:hypothetical protein